MNGNILYYTKNSVLYPYFNNTFISILILCCLIWAYVGVIGRP